MPDVERLRLAQARRMALAAQGFGPRPPAVGPRRLLSLVERLNLLQIDSVNVLVRSHYLPAFSRLGCYDTGQLDRLAYDKHLLFEAWAHEASLLPVATEPLLRWRKEVDRRRRPEVPRLVPEVRARIAAEGPLAASELGGPGTGSWWGWSEAKRAVEWLFAVGEVAVAGRRRSFERLYDLPERVLAASVLARPTPPEDEARRVLLVAAADALGPATASDLADYFRMSVPKARPRIAELVEDGALLPVSVEGWSAPAYVRPDAVVPHRVRARALLSPFDPVVWERSRAERLFGFRYRIEIYTPREQRVHGYYVLPFLLGDRLVARVDLKADRAAGRLLVPGLSLEQPERGGPSPEQVRASLDAELELLARWLGLSSVDPLPSGGGRPSVNAERA